MEGFNFLQNIVISLSLRWCQGCLDEERRLLLQIKDSIRHLKGVYPRGTWVGENCCQWSGVSCSSSSSHVVSLILYNTIPESASWYPNASLFAQFTQLESLDLYGNQIGGWVMPEAFSHMKSLEGLYLSSNNLNASIKSLSALCWLRNLKWLDLSYNNLDDGDIPPCLSTNLSSLETLYLYGNNLRSLHAFSHMKSLEKLNLWGNNLNASNKSLSALCGLRNLKILDLSSNDLDDGDIPPCLSTNLSSLETLSLYGNNLRSLHVAFSHMKSLERLNLGLNNLTASIKSLSALCGLRNLKSLELSSNNLDDGDIPPCLSTNLSSLQSLFLMGNNLRSLHAFSHMKSLEQLDLWGNNLNASNKSLSALCGLRNLKILDLSSNNLDDGDIPPCLSTNLSSLETLFLNGNNLRSLHGFSQMKSLTNLYLMDNRLNESINSLSGRCSHCEEWLIKSTFSQAIVGVALLIAAAHSCWRFNLLNFKNSRLGDKLKGRRAGIKEKVEEDGRQESRGLEDGGRSRAKGEKGR